MHLFHRLSRKKSLKGVYCRKLAIVRCLDCHSKSTSISVSQFWPKYRLLRFCIEHLRFFEWISHSLNFRYWAFRAIVYVSIYLGNSLSWKSELINTESEVFGGHFHPRKRRDCMDSEKTVQMISVRWYYIGQRMLSLTMLRNIRTSYCCFANNFYTVY